MAFSWGKNRQKLSSSLYHDAGNPETEAPISVNWISESNFPLNSGRYAASVYGQWTEGEPLYMGVYVAAHISKGVNSS